MKRTAGLFLGVIYILFAFGAYKTAAAGWTAGRTELGVWWTVVGVLLTLAGVSALVGTWIHAWSVRDSH